MVSSRLHHLDTPTRQHPDLVVVFGQPMTREEALGKALDLSKRGDHHGAARVLSAAGLWPHDLVDWSQDARSR